MTKFSQVQMKRQKMNSSRRCRSNPYSKEELIDIGLRVGNISGKTWGSIAKNRRLPSVSTIQFNFEGWTNFRKELEKRGREPIPNERLYSRERLIEIGMEVGNISSDEWKLMARKEDLPSPSTIYHHFGTWTKLRKELSKRGREPSDRRRTNSPPLKEKKKDNMLKAGLENRLLTWGDWRKSNSHPKAISSNFGSWTDYRKQLFDKFCELNYESFSSMEEKVLNSLPKYLLDEYNKLNLDEKFDFMILFEYNSDRIENMQPMPQISTQRPSGYLISKISNFKISKFLLEQYVKLYWNSPLFEGKRFHKSLSSFIEFRDPCTGKITKKSHISKFFMSRYRRYRRKNGYVPILKFMSEGQDAELLKKVKKLDDGTRRREFIVEKYIELFWDNPLPHIVTQRQIKNMKYIINKNLISFARSFSFSTGEYIGNYKGELYCLATTFYQEKERIGIDGFFDYMVEDLDTELMERAGKLDSGERLKEYLAEQNEKRAREYTK